MLATLIIVFREVLEAGLIVGIILAATRGVPRRGLWITGGCGAGLLGAIVVAGFASEIADGTTRRFCPFPASENSVKFWRIDNSVAMKKKIAAISRTVSTARRRFRKILR